MSGTAGRRDTDARTAAIVLAAGLSSRMAPLNKLLVADAAGVPMIGRVLDGVIASRAGTVILVVGHQAAEVQAAAGRRAVRIVHASEYASGMAASLRAGLAALPEGAARALICLGDMPLVGPALIDRLIDAHEPDADRLIIVPTYRGRRGNPILWDRRFFAEMACMQGDAGARSLLGLHAGSVAEVACDDDQALVDCDGPGLLPLGPDGAWKPHTPAI